MPAQRLLELIHYSQKLVLPLQIILIALLVSAFAVGLQRQAITVRGIRKGLLGAAGTTADNMAAGIALLWLLLSTVTTFLAPGASYLLQWPLLAVLVVLAYRFVVLDPDAFARTVRSVTASK